MSFLAPLGFEMCYIIHIARKVLELIDHFTITVSRQAAQDFYTRRKTKKILTNVKIKYTFS